MLPMCRAVKVCCAISKSRTVASTDRSSPSTSCSMCTIWSSLRASTSVNAFAARWRRNVVFPAPLPPMMPTMLPLGTEKLRLSIRTRSPKPLLRLLTSITLSPKRSPGGMYNSWVSLRFWKSLELSSSKRAIRALLWTDDLWGWPVPIQALI